MNAVEPQLRDALRACFKALMAIPSREVSLICKVAAVVARSFEQDAQFEPGLELCQVGVVCVH